MISCKKRQTITLIVSLAFVGFSSLCILNSCSSCHDKTYPSLSFSEEDLMIVPYTGDEQLVFFNSTGDSIIFSGGYRGSESLHAYIYDVCRIDYYSEINYCHYEGPEMSAIEILLTFGGDNYESIKKYSNIALYFPKSMSIGYFQNISMFTGTSFELSPTTSLVHSIQIGSRFYDSVYLLTTGINSNYSEYIQDLYYSLDFGIVGVRSNNGNLWALK